MKDKPPEYYGMLTDGDHLRGKNEGKSETEAIQAAYGYDFTPREALKTRSFWLMIVALA
jgi:hypothetical protein